MQNDNSKIPDQPARDTQDNRKPSQKDSVEHVVKTGLPPGIDPDQALDPGASAPDKGPSDNRS
jgi:hypothetical protein